MNLPRRARADGDFERGQSRLLSDWRSEPAYVLLGEPGAGKSISFAEEAAAQPGGVLVEARDVVDGVASAEGLTASVVFIDGFDQIKAGGRRPGLDALGLIRAWLARAKPAGFRISCRQADWLGASERDALARLAPQGRVGVLQLETLTRDEALILLRRREADIGDADTFWQAAEQHQMTALFGNPLLLDMMVDAVMARGGQWPATRSEVFEAACERLVTETSQAHLMAQDRPAGWMAQLLDTAGMLCALLLLSGKAALSVQVSDSDATIDLTTLPPELALPAAREALATKIFVAPGGQAQPRHRSIAEHLAARALARRLNDGLPLDRVLALILGQDGRPVEALRGLLAWLAVEHLPSRPRLLQLDPLGFILNGDPARLGRSERLDLLHALAERAAENPWFRQDAWVSHPFGALATADMAADYLAALNRPERDPGHQAFIDCVLDALCHCESMPSLAPALATWVVDTTASEGNRVAALQAWRRHCLKTDQPRQERAWLLALKAGTLGDDDHRLLGTMLHDAYPDRVGPDEVLDYLRPLRDRRTINRFDDFWGSQLLDGARPGDATELANQWLLRFRSGPADDEDRELRELSAELLAQALRESGDGLADERLYEWLALGLTPEGFCRPAPDGLHAATAWLEARPARMQAILKLGYEAARPEEQGRRYFWWAEERLLGASLPRDHLHWLLREFCTREAAADLAHYVFAHVVREVINPTERFDVPRLEDIERWAAEHADAEHPFPEWLAELTTWPLDHWAGEQHRRQRQRALERAYELKRRHAAYAPLLETLADAAPHTGLMHQIAHALQGRFFDVRGDTPIEQVQDLLGAGIETATMALKALDRTLQRDDLPDATAVLTLAEAGSQYLLQDPALVSAERCFAADPQAPLSWPEPLCQCLVALYLCHGLGEMPDWYRFIVRERPAVVAPVFLAYAQACLSGRHRPPFTGFWALAGEDDHAALTALALPDLLAATPLRIRGRVREELQRHLLPALHRLPASTATALIAARLAMPALNPLQRLSWLVADLRYRASAIDELIACVANSRSRRMALGTSLDQQRLLDVAALPNEPRVLGALIDVLAPLTPRRMEAGAYWVGPAETREETLRVMFNRLAQSSAPQAAVVLRALSAPDRDPDWRRLAEYSAHAQRSVARQARFEVAPPAAVALALANRAPAHQADLKALLLDNLGAIEAELRGANTSALNQFWADDGRPRTENECRDLLLEKLRVRLAPLGVLVEPEVAAADLKRMDMKLTFGAPGRAAISLPVEAKKDSHAELWTACSDQLERLYSIDPQAGGHGVYLVFWFGTSTHAKSGQVAPTHAQALQDQLKKEQDERSRALIAVHVVDLSRPGRAATQPRGRRRC